MSPIQLLAAVLLILIVPHAIKRRKEADSQGNATLRYFGLSLLGALSSTFWAYRYFLDRHDPFFQRFPENLNVDLFFLGLSLFAAVWFYVWKTTLTNELIVDKMWPFTRRYPLAQLESIEEKQIPLLQFAGGKKFAILPFASGQPFFLETLRALTSRSRGTP